MYKRLMNKDYLLLCQGTIFSAFGAVLYSAAIAYWIYEKTGSTTLMGVLSGVSFIVRVFAGPICGSLSDHLRRRNVLVCTDLIRGIIFLMLGFLALSNRLNVILVVVAALVSGVCSSLFDPSSTSLVPDILDEKILIKGQSVMNGSSMIINLVGTALSGILIVKFGVPILILVNGICYIISAISEKLIRDYPSHKEEGVSDVKTILKDMKEGFDLIRNDRGLMKLGLIVILSNLLISGMFNLLLPYCLQNGMSTQQYGYLGAIISAGSLIGTLLLALVDVGDKKPFRIVGFGMILFSILGASAIYVASFVYTSALFFLCFVLNGIFNGILNALFILMIPEDKRGVMSGTFMAASMLGNAASSLIYGILGDLIPIRTLGVIAFLLGMIPIALVFDKDVQNINEGKIINEKTSCQE
ncbi:MAG: MFS transporter [Erysipelotrichaceae bacterium]|nr:MFS transporter [Erysipelotrichaceae bacterium]